ncbi:hypothetical protein ACGF0J_00635 [Nonomuraea sp. NPDC047897]|uniref:hypothetical protein n=1 Tax=Nonomuraea sp. NPDC047897 TaxID=3364346 RepID=UPI003721F03D
MGVTRSRVSQIERGEGSTVPGAVRDVTAARTVGLTDALCDPSQKAASLLHGPR